MHAYTYMFYIQHINFIHYIVFIYFIITLLAFTNTYHRYIIFAPSYEVYSFLTCSYLIP